MRFAQPAGRSVRKLRTKDEMARSILDGGGDDAILVLRVCVGLEAGDEASPHPDGLSTERQCGSDGSTIGNATGSDDGDGVNRINHSREQ